jgi:spermidine/putrescine transport system substrate-binding protein
MTHLDRRQFNLLVGSSLAAGAGAGLWPRPAKADAGKTITVLNWQGYGTDEPWGLKEFAAATGIEVKHDYFNSEPEMLTKLRTNPGAYDVVLINSARTRQAQAEALIDPIDFSKVPNSKDLAPPLRGHSNINIDGKPFGIAWVWGINGLAVRRGKVANADSFTILSDPAYVNRVALLDDAVTEIGVGALLTGQDINDPKDFKAIGDALKAMKKNVKLIWSSEDEWDKDFAAGAFDVAIYWSGACVRSQRHYKLPVDFIVPKEGAIGWLDNLCIPATSSKKDLGLTFINFMIDPKFYVEWATKVGAPASANSVAMNELPADDLNREVHKPEYLSKLQFMSFLPDDRRETINALWDEVKAYYAK